jgi:hypothetical protein
MKYNFKKTGIATAVTMAIAGTTLITTSGIANATVFSSFAAFRTVADVNIVENTAASFGTFILGKAGTNCIITSEITDGGGAPTIVDAFASATDVTGTGCNGTDNAVNGDYSISGANDASITILLESVDLTDFTYAPAGQYNNMHATTSISTSYNPDGALTVSLSAAGTGRLSVGGELSVVNDLDASTSYLATYDISVVY